MPRRRRYQPLFKVSLGSHRLFVSVINYGEELALGFPLDNCRARRVWAKDDEGIDMISFHQAKAMLSSSIRSNVLSELRINGEFTRLLGNG